MIRGLIKFFKIKCRKALLAYYKKKQSSLDFKNFLEVSKKKIKKIAPAFFQLFA